MNKTIFALVLCGLVFVTTSKAFSQIVGEKSFSWACLPLRTTDFHNFNRSHTLPSMGEYMTALNNTYYSPLIDLFEYKGKVKRLNVKIYKSTMSFGKQTFSSSPSYENVIEYDNHGDIVYLKNKWGANFSGRVVAENPKSTKRITNSKGLITDVIKSETRDGINHITYEYDNNGRVVVANSHTQDGGRYDSFLIFKYSYLPSSDNVSEINVYDGKNGKLIGSARYGYNNNKLLYIECDNPNDMMCQTEKKTFTYDSMGNIKSLQYISRGLVGEPNCVEYQFNNIYSKNLLAACHYTRSFNRNHVETVKMDIQYDGYGNWIELSEDNIIIKREFEYYNISSINDATSSLINVGIAPISVTASSCLPSGGKHSYVAHNVVDGNIETAWAAAPPIGQSLKFKFKQPIKIQKLFIKNGMVKSESLYYKNSRVKILDVLINGNKVKTITLNDEMKRNGEYFNLNIMLKANEELTLLINDIYKGSHYNEVVVTDIQFY